MRLAHGGEGVRTAAGAKGVLEVAVGMQAATPGRGRGRRALRGGGAPPPGWIAPR